MRLKSPSLHKPRLRVMLALGMAVVGFTGLAFAQASPALADPTVTLVAVGSDTIQDVYNQFGLDASGNLLGSYDAVNPVTQAAHEIITPVDGTATAKCSFARPNGSGEGVADLRLAINPATTNGTAAPLPSAQQGCVDIGRSSSGPGSLQSNTGPLVYVPFALDGVAGATGPASCPGTTCASYQYTYTGSDNAQHTVTATPTPTVLANVGMFTLHDLQTLYKNCTAVTANGVTYDPNTPNATGTTKIDLYVPQSGSGTRNFWATTLGFSNSSLPACVHDTIVGGPLATATPAVPVEEHNGTPMATDPNGFGPFSIAQWISQRNGHNDRRHTAVVQNLGPCTDITNPATCTAPVSPFSNGNPATGGLNTGFPITRQVFSVVSFARVTNPADPLFSLLNNANPSGATVCVDSLQIASYGFANLGATCGAVLTANRAQG